jgi:hypothetical protein
MAKTVVSHICSLETTNWYECIGDHVSKVDIRESVLKRFGQH